MGGKTETEEFLSKKRASLSSDSAKCYAKWWVQGYEHQEVICRTIESVYFRALVIFLVVADTALIIVELMLDSYQIRLECESHGHKSPKEHHDVTMERVERTMQAAHYSSIGILCFFLVELLLSIYANGKGFWNLRKKKMEYFDAFIVITSLAIDLYLLRMEEKVISGQLHLVFSFRLWRFVRIISSVAEGVRHGEEKHKQHLSKQYNIAIHRLVDLVKHKTTYAENNSEDFNSILEHFHMIDNQCQSSLEAVGQNHQLTTSAIVRQFVEDLTGLENKNNTSIISAMFQNSSSV